MTKQKQVNFLDLFSLFFRTKLFENKVNVTALIGFNAVFLILISFFSGLKEQLGVGNFLFGFFGVLIGMPLIIFLIFGLMYITIQAFERTTHGFLESVLVFSSIFLPMAFIVHILNFISSFTFNSVLLSLVGFIIFLIGVYFIYLVVSHLKNYYQVSGYRIFFSFILTTIIILILSIAQYLVYLLRSLI